MYVSTPCVGQAGNRIIIVLCGFHGRLNPVSEKPLGRLWGNDNLCPSSELLRCSRDCLLPLSLSVRPISTATSRCCGNISSTSLVRCSKVPECLWGVSTKGGGGMCIPGCLSGLGSRENTVVFDSVLGVVFTGGVSSLSLLGGLTREGDHTLVGFWPGAR